jgi:hypothetical protein
MLVDLLNGAIPAYLDSQMNLVDVRDAAAGHLLAALWPLNADRWDAATSSAAPTSGLAS